MAITSPGGEFGQRGQEMKKIVACTLVVLAANVALFLTDYAGGRPDTSEALLNPTQGAHQQAPVQLADETPLTPASGLTEAADFTPAR